MAPSRWVAKGSLGVVVGCLSNPTSVRVGVSISAVLGALENECLKKEEELLQSNGVSRSSTEESDISYGRGGNWRLLRCRGRERLEVGRSQRTYLVWCLWLVVRLKTS